MDYWIIGLLDRTLDLRAFIHLSAIHSANSSLVLQPTSVTGRLNLKPAVWFVAFILTLAALVVSHFFWRKRFASLEGRRAAEIEVSQRRQQQTSVDAKAQQQVLFNSMIEGLLLLDRTQKIYLANRAFKNLFGLKVELRGKTILEALRLHELDELVQRVQAEGQVFDYEVKLPELTERWLRVNAAVISNSAGEREGMIMVFHDLTRLKQLERTRGEIRGERQPRVAHTALLDQGLH